MTDYPTHAPARFGLRKLESLDQHRRRGLPRRGHDQRADQWLFYARAIFIRHPLVQVSQPIDQDWNSVVVTLPRIHKLLEIVDIDPDMVQIG